MGGKNKMAKIIEERRLKAEAKKKEKEELKNTASNQKEAEDVVVKTNQDEPSHDASSPEPKSAGPQHDDNDDSSEESEGRIDIPGQLKEKAKKSKEETEGQKANWILGQDTSSEPKQDVKPKEVKKNASDITFGRKPMGFSNKNKKGTGFAGAKDDFVALDDIEKIDNKKDKKQKIATSAADGGKPFENMGSTAVEKNKRQEEEKEKEKEPMFKSTGVRPKFTGRVKIGGGETQQNTGSNTLYSMDVKYKSENAEGNRNHEKKDKNDGQTEVRKDKRKINQDRRTFDQDKAFNEQDLEDEGFRMTNTNRRQQRGLGGGGFNRRDDEDSFAKADNEPKSSQLKRGGAFGNMNDSD